MQERYLELNFSVRDWTSEQAPVCCRMGRQASKTSKQMTTTINQMPAWVALYCHSTPDDEEPNGRAMCSRVAQPRIKEQQE